MQKIAVVGLSCLLPEADNPDQFWANLLAEKSFAVRADAREMGVDPEVFYSPDKGTPDTTYCLYGNYLRNFHFDPQGYHIDPDFLAGLGRIFQWSLYVAGEALQHSGYRQRSDVLQRCGVILGNLSFPTRESNRLFLPIYRQMLNPLLSELLDRPVQLPPGPDDAPPPSLYNALISGYPAAVIAHALGLGGVNLALDAACASSLYAVKLACDYLNSGQADLMLAGAVSGADPFFVSLGFSTFRAYPDDNTSRPLDQQASGLLTGEGAGMFVLKRYADALRDGDDIHAVIRGIGLSNDGQGKSLLSPNLKGQRLAFERAYADAELDPPQIDYVECHATGTPLGDRTEMATMDAFFGQFDHAPYIGSVKSNYGHSLTAAGMTAMLKVILSMKAGRIPATVNITEAIHSPNGRFGPARVVSQTMPWPERDPVKRAAVSAFGFGGTNAHLILEAPPSTETHIQPHPPRQEMPRLAIVGMDAFFGTLDGLSAVDEAFQTGQDNFGPLPPERWRGLETGTKMRSFYSADHLARPQGAFSRHFELDFLRFRIPPAGDDHPIPQQLLALKTADRAIQDAGFRGSESRPVGVIIAMGTEVALHQVRGRCDLAWQLDAMLQTEGITLNDTQRLELETLLKDSIDAPAQLNRYISAIGNLMASRVAARWDFSGPAFTLAAEENSVFKALEIAQHLLRDDQLEAVVVGAVDLAASAESVLLRNLLAPANAHPQGLAFDEQNDGWAIGEGAGAVVLKRLDRAKVEADQVYAVIDGLALVHECVEPGQAYPFTPGPNSLRRAGEQALQAAGLQATDIDYLEASASGIAPETESELTGLTRLYGRPGEDGPALGSAKAILGHTYAAAGMAALLRAALSLHNGYLPPTPHWISARWPATIQKAGFQLPTARTAWKARHPRGRIAAISSLGLDGAAAHLILSAPELAQTPRRPAKSSAKGRQLRKTIVLGGKRIAEQLQSAQQTRHFAVPPATAPQALIVMQEQSFAPAATRPVRPEPSSGNETRTTFSTNWPADLAAMMRTQHAAVSTAHRHFLTQRQQGMHALAQQLAGRIDGRKDGNGHQSETLPLWERTRTTHGFEAAYNRPSQVIWDEDDLLELAQGQVSKVFGPEYALIDTFPRQVRLPMPPYLLVSRITALDAELGAYRPATLQTEYDIPLDAWYAVDGQAPLAVALESGQCDLLLISYIGIDFENQGHRVYRLLEGTITFLDELPKVGRTLRYDIRITSYARSGENLLFFFSYECYVDSKLILTMENGCAGFFSDEELDQSRGILYTPQELAAREHVEKRAFTPLLECTKTQFNQNELQQLSHGNLAACFGPVYAPNGANVSLRFPNPDFVFIDRITHIDPQGGLWGLGLIEAEQQLHPDDWFFPCHFKDDEVMAGSLMAQGCDQLVQFYALYLGLHTRTHDARFQPLPQQKQYVRCRGQVRPADATLSYRMEVKEIGLEPEPYLIADVDMMFEGKWIVHFENLGLCLREKTSPASLEAAIEVAYTPSPNPAFPRDAITEFATGSIAACFGPEYDIYESRFASRIPRFDLQLLDRAVAVEATRHNFKLPARVESEYDLPPDSWISRASPHPGSIPYSMLMELALQPDGFLSAYLGSCFIYRDQALHFRNLSGEATVHHDLDMRGRTLSVDAKLAQHTAFGQSIIQDFDSLLHYGDTPLFEVKAQFGYFTAAQLAAQVGLDQGRRVAPWHETAAPAEAIRIDLHDPAQRHRYLDGAATAPHYHLAREHLALLHEALVVPGGGEHNRGYIFGRYDVDPQDWYFECHFKDDPVMPGSLGLAAVQQALRLFALQQDLGQSLQQPRFGPVVGQTMTWQYRGQIVPSNKTVTLEIHLHSVDASQSQVVLLGDASVWADGLRIYHFKNVGLCLSETPPASPRSLKDTTANPARLI